MADEIKTSRAGQPRGNSIPGSPPNAGAAIVAGARVDAATAAGIAAATETSATDAATGDASTIHTPPAADGPVKATVNSPTGAVRETVDVSTDSTGNPRSAELRQETAPLDPLGERIVRTPAARRPFGSTAYAGSLPARTRVMPGGRTMTITAEAEDTTERLFTAASRILRSGALYEPGSTVPLTQAEFVDKSRGRSIVETDWRDGEDFDD